jgi:Double zinc ribbon
MAKPRYCKRCGFVGVHNVEKEITGAQWAALVVLLLLLVIPGIVYGIYLAMGGGAKGYYICPKCGARRMSIPSDSPLVGSQIPQASGEFCSACGKPVLPTMNFCAACGAKRQAILS